MNSTTNTTSCVIIFVWTQFSARDRPLHREFLLNHLGSPFGRCYSADFIVGRIYLVCGLFELVSCLFWAINTRHIYEAYHTWKMFAPIPSHSIAGLGRREKEEFVYFINLFLSARLWSLFRWIISCARPLQNNNFSICITRWCLWENWIEKRAKALIICLWILFSGGFRRRRRRILIMLRKSIMDHYYYGVPLNEIESESTRGWSEQFWVISRTFYMETPPKGTN